MELKFGTKEKTIVLVILIILGVIINTLSPVSISKQNAQAPAPLVKTQMGYKDLEKILSSINYSQEEKIDSSCLFIGCGSAF